VTAASLDVLIVASSTSIANSIWVWEFIVLEETCWYIDSYAGEL
jgi:hypothetical protein